jgi:uncharacterized protein YbjT (DUF2867 family)
MGKTILLTGATGMVGEGVLHQAVQHNSISKIYVLGRKPCGYQSNKVEDIIVSDFMNLTEIESNLKNIDACLFCAGVSSVGMSKELFYKLTYTNTMHVANTLARLNTNMIFCYISGAGTNSKEIGKADWANTKGKTENDLMQLPFSNVYNFRPGVLMPTKGLKNTLSYYKYLGWLGSVIKLILPNTISTLAQLGDAMVYCCFHTYEKQTIEVIDIKILADKLKSIS